MEHTAENHAEPGHADAQFAKRIKGYRMWWGFMLFCMGTTVWLSFVNFGSPGVNIVAVLVMATIQASCAAAIFMHLKSEQWTIYRFLLVTILFAIGLFALTALAMNDRLHLN